MVKSSKTADPEVIARVKAKIKPARDLEDYHRVLLYGRSGSRKTRTASSAPKVLLIDVNEKGTASVRQDYNPHVFPVEFWSEINDVYWYLHSGDHPFLTYAIDGVTGLQNLCMKFVLGDESARDASKDPDMPTRQIYNKIKELMTTQITNFRNLPMHGVFTALERSRSTGEDDDLSDSVTTPSCTPSVADVLEAAVGIIGHMGKRSVNVRVKPKGGGKPKRVTRTRVEMLVGDSDRYITKERYGVLPDVVQAPNLTEVFALLDGKVAE